MTGGRLVDRARGLGVPAVEVDGRDVTAVWEASQPAIERARSGQGPTFLHASCVHLEGHFLGFQLLRAIRDPLGEMTNIGPPLTRSLLRPGGAALRGRLAGLSQLLGAMRATQADGRQNPANDPVPRARRVLLADPARLQELEEWTARELVDVVAAALMEVTP